MSANPFEPYDPPKLTIELVPMGQWFDNVRAKISEGNWGKLKHACFTQAKHRCTICNGVGKKHPVECHEIWHYDDDKKVQKLLGLISLCPSCHRVKHIGNAARMGLLVPTLKHLAKVNNWPLHLAEAYSEVCMNQWEWRSMFLWSLDLSWLDSAPEYIKAAFEFEKASALETRRNARDSVLSQLALSRSSSS